MPPSGVGPNLERLKNEFEVSERVSPGLSQSTFTDNMGYAAF